MTVEPDPQTEAQEPCPTPLNWRQVLDEFRAQRCAVEIPGNASLTVWTIGSGQPLYFLNPACGDHEQFTLLAWLLRDEFQCVLFDEPAARLSGAPDLALERLASTPLAIADELGHEQIDLFAPAFGGLVALQTMLSAPQRIESAVLVGVYAGRSLTAFERGLLFWGRWVPGRLSVLPGWSSILTQNHRLWFPPFDDTRWQFLVDNFGGTPIRQVANRLDLAGHVDLGPRLSEITAPVHLVETEGAGRVVTELQRHVADLVSSATVHAVDTTGQLPYLTHPHRVAKLVRSALKPAESVSGPVS